MSRSKQLICLSTVPWSEKITRRQMIMSRMRDVEIVYIDPPTGRRSVITRKPEPVSPYPHIRVYSPTGAGDSKRLSAFLESVIQKEELAEPLVWLYSPVYLDAVRHLKKAGLVYDAAENPSHTSPRDGSRLEKELCEAADVVFAAQMTHYDRIEAYQKKTYLIPSGIDYRPKTSLSDEALGVIARMEELPKPLYGFAGALRRSVDFEMLEKIADAGKSLLVVAEAGADEAAVKEEVERLEARENVLLIRAASQSAILEYIRSFDVCVSPLTAQGASDELFTRVFFEYLASGKPIVTSPYPAIVKNYGDVADVSEVGDIFLKMVLTAEERFDLPRKERQIAYAKALGWDARVAEMRRLLAREGFLID
ncbi:MAG: glycosyltransferase [Clostridia bacterium]|nr:glycosyltransferase [Clostridia bacterium]